MAAAAQLFAQVAQAEPENLRALAGLARCHLAAGDIEQARATFDLVADDKKADPIFSGIEAAIALAAEGDGTDLGAARSAAEAAPDDLTARFAYAGALIGAGSTDDAIDELLAIIEKDREWDEGAARKNCSPFLTRLAQPMKRRSAADAAFHRFCSPRLPARNKPLPTIVANDC